MPIDQTAGLQTEETSLGGLDLADPNTREFVDHLIALLALEYVERMRRTSDSEDLTVWDALAETTDKGRNR